MTGSTRFSVLLATAYALSLSGSTAEDLSQAARLRQAYCDLRQSNDFRVVLTNHALTLGEAGNILLSDPSMVGYLSGLAENSGTNQEVRWFFLSQLERIGTIESEREKFGILEGIRHDYTTLREDAYGVLGNVGRGGSYVAAAFWSRLSTNVFHGVEYEDLCTKHLPAVAQECWRRWRERNQIITDLWSTASASSNTAEIEAVSETARVLAGKTVFMRETCAAQQIVRSFIEENGCAFCLLYPLFCAADRDARYGCLVIGKGEGRMEEDEQFLWFMLSPSEFNNLSKLYDTMNGMSAVEKRARLRRVFPRASRVETVSEGLARHVGWGAKASVGYLVDW